MAKPAARKRAPAHERPRRTTIARRVLLTLLVGNALVVGGLAVISWLALGDLLWAAPPPVEQFGYQLLGRLLQPATLGAIVGLLLLVPLAVWIVARRTLRPLGRLAEGVLALQRGEFGTRVPAARGEVGELATGLNDLSLALLRSSERHENQQRALAQAVRRLEALGRVVEELSSTLDLDDLLRATAQRIRRAFEYERVGVALVEGNALAFRFSSAAEDIAVAPAPAGAPLSERLAAGRAALSGQPQLVALGNGEPRTGLPPGNPVAQSELAVPVPHGGQVLAVISVQSARQGAFGEEDTLLLTSLAPALGFAVANASRFRAEQLRRQLAEAIYRISQSISSTATLESVPGLLLDQIARVLPFDRSAVLLLHGQQLRLEAERGETGGWRWQRAGDAITPDALVDRALREGRAQRLDAAGGAGGERPRSAMAAPLLRQGRPVGAVAVERDQPSSYGDDEQQALLALAGQAAVAMENAALYAEAHERSNRLKVVSELFDDVSSTRNLAGVLHTIVQRIRMFVPCDHASIAHYEPSNNSFLLETLYDAASPELPAATRFGAGDTPWKSVFDTSVPSYSRDLRQSIFPVEQQLAAAGLRAYAVVPIASEGGSLGTLNLASRTPAAFSQEQIGTLTELSRYLASAMLNASQRLERERTVSELARAQERLALTARLNAVGELAGGIAHDFNNLLAGILGNAQLLLFEAQGDDQREMLHVIERAARGGAETVRRLQTFTRVDHDSAVGEVQLHLIARDAIDLTRPRWRDLAQKQGRPIEVRRELLPVPSLIGRAGALRDVVTNLIINAIDAMPQGGTLSVRTYQIPELGEEPPPGAPVQVVVQVSDTGTGMSPALLERIFERYFTTKGRAGTGQGLSEVQEKVAEHGGDVEVASQEGAGSTFTVRLPVRAAGDADLAEAAVDLDAPMTPAGILVIEDEELVRLPLVRLLTRWGHRVAEATCAADAFDLFVPGRYDVLITDLGLPDMPGREIVRRARALDSALKTIMLTGWGDEGGGDEGAADFILRKPFDQSELRAVLARALR